MIYYRDKTQVQMSCFLNKNLKYDIVTVVLLLLWLFTPRVLQKMAENGSSRLFNEHCLSSMEFLKIEIVE